MQENQLAENGRFLIKVRRGGWEVEVSGPDKEFVHNEIAQLIEQFNSVPEIPVTTSLPENRVESSNGTTPRYEKEQTLNEFFRQFKSLPTHADKILVLAYWLELRQGQPNFTVEEMVAKYKEVRENPPANVKRDITNVAVKGYLRQDKNAEGAVVFSLTNSGIREVESKMVGESFVR